MKGMDRRTFLKAGSAALAGSLLAPTALLADEATRLVILHTNDTHSRIDPFPQDGSRYAGLGGVARRATLVEQVRRQEPHVLLLDSGDIFQGTPYFNLFHGEVEFKTMTALRYDAATIGNHDFDNGVDGLARVMPLAGFEMVSANYEVAGTPLAPFVQPYTIRDFGRFRVGIFGLGISFEHLVLPELHEGVTYHDPVEVARATVAELERKGCNLIVCLSHLGYRYREEHRISDVKLASLVPGVHLILGGHTHTFMQQADVIQHRNAPPTYIHQVGWAGIWLGRVDVTFDRTGTPRRLTTSHTVIGPLLG